MSTVVSILPRLLGNVHLRTLVDAVARAEQILGQAEVLAAASLQLGQDVVSVGQLEALLAERKTRAEFLAWLLWDHFPGRSAPLGAELLCAYPSGPARAVVQALLDTPPDCWEVVRRHDATGVWVRRLGCRGAPLFLRESVLAEAARPRDVWIGRVIVLQGVALLDAVHAWLPPSAAPTLRRRAKTIRSLPRRDQLAAWLQSAREATERLQRHTKRPQLAVQHQYWQLHEEAWQATLAALCVSGVLAQTPTGAVICRPTALAGVQLRWRMGRLRLTLWTPRQAEALHRWTEAQFVSAKPLVRVQTDARWLFAREARAPWTPLDLRALAESWLAAHFWQHLTATQPAAVEVSGPPQWWAQVRSVSRWAGTDWQSRLAALTARR